MVTRHPKRGGWVPPGAHRCWSPQLVGRLPSCVLRGNAPMLKVLFVCSQNRLRSVTAERIFRDHPHLEVRSAGTDRNAQVVRVSRSRRVGGLGVRHGEAPSQRAAPPPFQAAVGSKTPLLSSHSRQLRPDGPGTRATARRYGATDSGSRAFQTVVAISGKEHHTMAKFTGRASDVVSGTVFAVTPDEIRNADKYEVPAVKRVAVVLQSGVHAWAYVDARYAASDS
jgi:hypothetical protein